MVFEKIRDGEEGRVIPYRLKQVDMGMNEDLERETTCVIQWEVGRPMGKRGRKMPPRKTQDFGALEMAIDEVGLPADMEVLREAFYKAHAFSMEAMPALRATSSMRPLYLPSAFALACP